jgi:hypothetical protein
MITITVCLGIAAFVAACIFVPGMTTAVFTGLAKGAMIVFAENRDKRIERRQENGIFGLKKRKDKQVVKGVPDTKLEEIPTNVSTPVENVDYTSSNESGEVPAETIRDRLRDRREQRKNRREER